jgi:Flp pilus assembly protein TadG
MRRTGLALDTFRRDERGAFAIIAALSMPVAISAVVLGTEVGLYAFRHQTMQGAADAAALSGVISAATGTTLVTQGRAVAAAQGYVHGASNVTVTINSPPTSGSNMVAGAVEAIVSQPQQPILAKIFSSATVPVSARAVAKVNPGGACLLALNGTASGAITIQGTANVSLTGCDAFANSNNADAITAGGSSLLSVNSAIAVGGVPVSSNIVAVNGTRGGATAAPDPYASKAFDAFSGCTQTYSSGNVTLQPGVYCGGISLVAGAVVSMAPGVYYLDSSDLKVAGNATLTGTGVTIVFTSSKNKNYGSASISSNAVIDLSAPTSGPTAGIVLFGDRNMPTGTSFKLTGGGTQQWSGAIYLPQGDLTYAGGSSGGAGCTQIVANTVTFTGTSNLSLSCAGTNIKPAGNQTAVLVE